MLDLMSGISIAGIALSFLLATWVDSKFPRVPRPESQEEADADRDSESSKG